MNSRGLIDPHSNLFVAASPRKNSSGVLNAKLERRQFHELDKHERDDEHNSTNLIRCYAQTSDQHRRNLSSFLVANYWFFQRRLHNKSFHSCQSRIKERIHNDRKLNNYAWIGIYLNALITVLQEEVVHWRCWFSELILSSCYENKDWCIDFLNEFFTFLFNVVNLRM